MSRNSKARRRRSAPAFEALETRHLMTAELTGGVDVQSFLSSLPLEMSAPAWQANAAAEGEDRGIIVEPTVVGPKTSYAGLVSRYGESTAKSLLESVGRIEWSANGNTHTGSGTVLTYGGNQYVLTAAHVVENEAGQQVHPSRVSFTVVHVSTGIPGLESETDYEVGRIIGRDAFGQRDLALLELKKRVDDVEGADLPSAMPIVGTEVAIAGFGVSGFANGEPFFGNRNVGFTHVDAVNKTNDGTLGGNGHRTVGDHLMFTYQSGEAAIAQGDSGGPDFLASRDRRPSVVGVHSFFQHQRTGDPLAPEIGETTWSVQLTPFVVNQIKTNIPMVLKNHVQFGVRVKNDGDSFVSGDGEWRATLEVDGRQLPFNQNVSERYEPYWVPEKFIWSAGTRHSVRFWGKEQDDGFFTGGDDDIALGSGIFTVPGREGQASLFSRSGDTSYELVAKTSLEWVRFGIIDPGEGGGGTPAPVAAYQVVSGQFDRDAARDLFAFQVGLGQNILLPSSVGGGFGDPIANVIDPRAINGEFKNVAVGDFNGDHLDDIVFHAVGSGNNRWFFGRPDGGFDQQVLLIGVKSINGEFNHMVAGDFDGNGRTDLMFHATTSGNNRWYFSQPDGSFEERLVLIGDKGVNHEFDHLAVGDFNGDGKDDVVFHALQSGNNRWAFGRGDRNVEFVSNPQILASTVDHVFDQVVSADFNGDGRDDLLFYDADSGFNRWFLATAAGLFAQADNVIPQEELKGFQLAVAGDFDGDGAAGIAFYDVRGNWARSFEKLEIHARTQPRINILDERAVNGNFGNKAVGDFNGDGISDILFHDPHSGQNRWAYGRAEGGFSFESSSLIGEKGVNGEYDHVVVGDFNGDGRDDLLFHATASGSNRWFLRRPDGSLDFVNDLLGRAGVNGEFDHVVSGDFNGDGADDVLFHATASGNNRWWFGGKSGLSGNLELVLIATSAINGEFNNVASGDFNGDGADDLLFHATGSGNNRWAFGRRGGGFDLITDQNHPLIGQPGINHEYDRLGVGDINGDGRDDVVFFATGSGNSRRAYGRPDRTFAFDGEFRIAPELLRGMNQVLVGDFNGAGTDDLMFPATTSGRNVLQYSELTSGIAKRVATFYGDFDKDGDLDVIHENSNHTHTVEIWEHNSLRRTTLLGAIDSGWKSIGVGDFDADGDDDLLLRHANGTYQVKVMENGDWPELKSPGSIDEKWQLASIGDFDGDGDDDGLMRLETGAYLSLLMQNGEWVDHRDLGEIAPQWSVKASGDFDADGDEDLLLQLPDGTTQLRAMQNGNWSEAIELPAIDPAWNIFAAADFDGDGDADVLLKHTDGSLAVRQLQDSAAGAWLVVAQIDPASRLVAIDDVNGDERLDVVAYSQFGGRKILGVGEAVTRIAEADRKSAPANENEAPKTVAPPESIFHNRGLATDVDFDGNVSPVDALHIINYLNAGRPNYLTYDEVLSSHKYLDVDGDGYAAPGDVLMVINFLNAPTVVIRDPETPKLVIAPLPIRERCLSEAVIPPSVESLAVPSRTLCPAIPTLPVVLLDESPAEPAEGPTFDPQAADHDAALQLVTDELENWFSAWNG